MKTLSLPLYRILLSLALCISTINFSAACTHTPCVIPPSFTVTVCTGNIMEINFLGYTTFGSAAGTNCACGFVMPPEIVQVLGVQVLDGTGTPIPQFSFSTNAVTTNGFNSISPGNWAGFSSGVTAAVTAGLTLQIVYTVEVTTCNVNDVISAVQSTTNSIGTAGASGTGLPTSHICIAAAGPGSLPVELNYFRGKYNGSAIALNWETLSESNNDYFSIERSVDGIEFKEISRIQGMGNYSNPMLYSFIDESAYSSVNYYRLKQMDYDGSFTYSNVISIELPTSGSRLSVFPNPVNTNAITLNLVNTRFNNAIVEVYNFAGDLMQKQSLSTERNPLDIGYLSSGIYLVVVKTEKELFLERMIVN